MNPGMYKTALSIIHVNASKCLKHYKATDLIGMVGTETNGDNLLLEIESLRLRITKII